MAAKTGVLGLILSFSPYLRSAVGRFPYQIRCSRERSTNKSLSKSVIYDLSKNTLTVDLKGGGLTLGRLCYHWGYPV